MAHTSGPWKKSTTDRSQTCIRGAHGGLVATCEAGYQAMRDADADLISVAPELLDILKAAVARVELANTEGNPILSAWLPDAKAVLAKAEMEVGR